MLKSFSTHNFIHFTEAQRLEFKGGVNFFIGGNSSGKSAVLELIRRCLSHDINTTNSSFNVNHDIAYALCHFEFPGDGILPTNGLHVSNKNLKHVIACIFVDNQLDDTNPEKPFHYYKVICTIHLNEGAKDADDQVYVFVKRYRGTFASDAEALEPLDTSSFCSKWEKRKLESIMKHGSNLSWKDDIKILFQEIKSKTFNTDIKCDEDMSKIYSCIENTYVGVMPMRSIGPLQWTMSKRNKHECRDENYKIASDRAEILSELLGNDQVDEEVEKKFCEALSLPCIFKKDADGQIWVYFHDKPNVRRPLLKTPEGVLEAKQISLILSHKQLLTIALEEPDHGMHPHMVNKVREEILKRVPENKTVLVTSHQSAILDHETINRTFLFSERKTTDAAGKGRMHCVHLIPNDNKRFGCTEEMKQMLFSSFTLFVPGYTDRLIIEAVFALSINSEERINKMLGNIGDKESNAELRKYLSGIHVIEMHGETSGPKKKKFCNDIGRKEKTFMLYDFDMVELKEPPQLKIGGKKIGLEFSLKKEFCSREEFYYDRESFKQFQDACNNNQVFVWKYGSIESVINQIESNMDPALKKKMDVPIPKKNENKRSAQNWKSVLADRDADDIQELATALIDHSDEITRFFQFLKLMSQ